MSGCEDVEALTNINQSDKPNTVQGPKKANPFTRLCIFCVDIFKWAPVLFISSVLCWGYYVYLIEICLKNSNASVIFQIFYLIIFHYLFIMTLWSYGRTIFTRYGIVPKMFWFTNADIYKLSKATTKEARKSVIEEIANERNLHILCRDSFGSYRICEKCNLIKPDRAHHCSVCNRCILKMDHHCPWVNNCVQFSNYKFFVLFLGYSFTLCLFTGMTTLPYFIQFWKDDLKTAGRFHVIFLFFVSTIFMVGLASLFFYHIYLVIHNRSTLESFKPPILLQGPDENAFNLGAYRNMLQIFGENKWKWLIPINNCDGNGIIYESRSYSRKDSVAQAFGIQANEPNTIIRAV